MEILTLVVGWGLGLFNYAIVELVRRKHRRREVIAAVTGELRELQYTMAFVAYRLRAHLGLVTDEFLDRILTVVQGYSGPESQPKLAELIAQSRRERSEDERRERDLSMRRPDRVPMQREYGLPLLLSLAGEMAMCPMEFQQRVFRIKFRLDVYNQVVMQQRTQYEKTFDASITAENREIVGANLEEGCRQMADTAEMIVDMVAKVTSA